MFNKKSDKLQGLVACAPLINDGVSLLNVPYFISVKVLKVQVKNKVHKVRTSQLASVK